MSISVLALDIGTNTGWAHSCGAGGVWDLSVGPDESTGYRLIKLRGMLNDIKSKYGVDLVVFEAPRNLRYGHATRVLAQFQAVIEMWCIDNNVEYKGFSPTEIKRYATGSGHANKEQMLNAAKKKWPKIRDPNHADARWLLEMVCDTVLGEKCVN